MVCIRSPHFPYSKGEEEKESGGECEGVLAIV